MSKRRRKPDASVADEIGTLHSAVEGVRVLSEWAYGQTDEDARRALPMIQAMLELISDRMRVLHRGLLEGGK